MLWVLKRSGSFKQMLKWMVKKNIHNLNRIILFIWNYDISVRTKMLIFLFLNQNICCGYSKEPSQ